MISVALDSGLEFHITVPPGWWELPVISRDVDAAVAAVVDERLARSPDLLPRRDDIVELLVAAATEARATGAIYAAQVGIVERDDIGFSAGLIVALRPLPGLTVGHEAEQLDHLIRQLPAPDGVRESAVGAEAVSLGRLGTGVRHQARRRMPGGIDVVNVSYWFPVRGTAQTAIINVTSPNWRATRELVALVDQIVATIVVTPAARARVDR